METKENLEKCLEKLNYINSLLPSHHRWTKGTMYRDNKGKRAQPGKECRRCLVGCIVDADKKFGYDQSGTLIREYIKKSIDKLYGYISYGYIKGNIIPTFNDRDYIKFKDIKKVIKHSIRTVSNELLQGV